VETYRPGFNLFMALQDSIGQMDVARYIPVCPISVISLDNHPAMLDRQTPDRNH